MHWAVTMMVLFVCENEISLILQEHHDVTYEGSAHRLAQILRWSQKK